MILGVSLETLMGGYRRGNLAHLLEVLLEVLLVYETFSFGLSVDDD